MKKLASFVVVSASLLFGAVAPASAGGDLPFLSEPEPYGDCYLRSDVGVAFDTTMDASYRWTGGPVNGDNVEDEELDTGFFTESGYGCNLTNRLRAEVMFGYHHERDWEGLGLNSSVNKDISAVSHYTLMANFYLDLRKIRGIRPYIGAGVGLSYNIMDEWYEEGTTSRVEGDEDLSLAWSLMAGFGYDISSRTTFDLGYRYMNYGNVSSGRVDTTNSVNPPYYLNNMGTHQIKAGLRYRLQGASSLRDTVSYK